MEISLLQNPTLLAPALAWVLAQVSKLAGGLLREGRLDIRYLVSAGGMPSSHTAVVVALAARVGVADGVGSTTFALSVVLAALVMYDAAGVRRAVSAQARVLNRILEEVVEYQRLNEKRFRELLGHTPFEVFVGALLGVAIGLSSLG